MPICCAPRASLLCSPPIWVCIPARGGSVDTHPNQRPRAEQRRSITTSSQRRPSERSYPRSASTLPKYLIRNPESARFFSFHHHKRSSSHHSGREFYYQVFLPSPINDSESLLKKECTGTGHQPSDVGVFAAFLSIKVRREKGFQVCYRRRHTEISLSTEQSHNAEGYLAKRQLSSD